MLQFPTTRRLTNALRYAIVMLGLCFFVRCATDSAVSGGHGVLEEVKEDNQMASMSSAPNNPKLTRLAELLQSCGYEALGLQFEPDDTLDFLFAIFSNLKTHNRQIRLIYTGLLMSYDTRHRSITIGGTKDVLTAVNYIEKNIPARPANEKVVLPPPVWLTPSPTPTPLTPPPAPVVPIPMATPLSTPTPTQSPNPYAAPTPTPSIVPNPTSSPSPESAVPSPTTSPVPVPQEEKPSPPPLFDTPEANPQDKEI